MAGHKGGDEAAVRAYVEGIGPAHRPLWDRVEGLIRAEHPDVTARISYDMPTFEANGRRLYAAAWSHGVSLYGWGADRDGGFSARHPELLHGRGTVRLRPADAEALGDDELRSLVRAALAP